MKKLFSTTKQDKASRAYNKLQKKRKKIKRNSLVMILLLFGVNAFAWFTYVSQADLNFNAKVVAWDVDFFNGSTEVNDIVIDVGKIYPGFGDASIDSSNVPYKKTIKVSNTGEVPAEFSYRVEKFTIMGQDAIVGNYSDTEFISLMEKNYPFTIKMSSTADKIKPGETLNYEFELYWLFEESNAFYKLNSLYTYDPSFTYYTYSGGSYEVASVNEATFVNLRDNLYLQKDDADSYFGQMCATYEANTGKKCVSVDVKLKVSQILE